VGEHHQTHRGKRLPRGWVPSRCRIHTMTTKAPEGWSATGGHWLLAWRLGVETSRGDVREREVKQINVVMHSA
jgi:hypothetical protein